MPAPVRISLSSTRPPPRPAPKKRPLAALGGADSDSDHSDHETPHKLQAVSTFSRSRGAHDATAPERAPTPPLTIPALANRDWRKEAELRGGGRKKSLYIPESAQKRDLTEDDLRETENTGAGETYGLQTFAAPKAPADDGERGDGEDVPEKKPMTEDERAIAALTGAAQPESDLVIDRVEDKDWRSAGGNEDDAFRRDVSSRPDVPSLEEYAAIPVEEFGAAMLRGMGWKGGEALGGKGGAGGTSGKLRLVEKRPALLGIGAKPVSEVPELGAWGKGDKKKRGGRPDMAYVPVVKVDKRTGKVVEEGGEGKVEELEKRTGSEMEKRREKSRSRSRERKSGGVRRDRDRREDRRDSDKRDSKRDDRDRGSTRRDEDSTRRRHRDRSSEWSTRDKDGRDRYDRDYRRERGGGRDERENDRRRRSRDRGHERRDRR